MKPYALGQVCLLALLAACASAPPPAPAPPAASSKPMSTAPASRDALYVELIAIRVSWVNKYLPDGETDAKLTSKKLGATLTKNLRNASDPREAIADSVKEVLGDSAVADPDRPKPNVVERQHLKELKHLSAAAKAGLGQFADHAKPGDSLDTPASDDEMVIVARALTAAAASR
jgi:hypothetical protein